MKRIAQFIAICFFLILGNTTVAQNLDSGLVAKFLFNQNIADSSTFRNDLESNYFHDFTYGKDWGIRQALKLVPSSSGANYLETKMINAAYNITDTLTISFWAELYDAALTMGDFVYHGTSFGNTKSYRASVFGGLIFNETAEFYDFQVASEFAHYVLIYENGNVRAYENGELSGFSYISINIPIIANSELVIGKLTYLDGESLDKIGALDDLYIYNRALTYEEIQLLYGRSVVGTENVQQEKKIEFIQSESKLKFTQKYNQINLFSSTGKVVAITANSSEIDVSNLSSGVYIIHVVETAGHFKTAKFIKK